MNMQLHKYKSCARSAIGTSRSIPRTHVAHISTRRRLSRVGAFDEGAAQVRRLLDRDRKELDFDQLEKSFADKNQPSNTDVTDTEPEQTPRGLPLEATPSNSGAQFAADKTPVSPFGPPSSSSSSSSSKSTVSPFGPSMGGRKSFMEPSGLSPDMQPTPLEPAQPWWTKITTTQIVIVLSFTTIISLMIATFFFVLNVGAVRFNE